MFYVYLLKSKKDGALYIGYTKDLRRRMEEHQKGRTFTTRKHLPVELVCYEAYKSDQDAILREKRGKALGQLRRRINESLSNNQKGAG